MKRFHSLWPGVPLAMRRPEAGAGTSGRRVALARLLAILFFARLCSFEKRAKSRECDRLQTDHKNRGLCWALGPDKRPKSGPIQQTAPMRSLCHFYRHPFNFFSRLSSGVLYQLRLVRFVAIGITDIRNGRGWRRATQTQNNNSVPADVLPRLEHGAAASRCSKTLAFRSINCVNNNSVKLHVSVRCSTRNAAHSKGIVNAFNSIPVIL